MSQKQQQYPPPLSGDNNSSGSIAVGHATVQGHQGKSEGEETNLSFTGPTETLRFDGILFDMDGTLIDSKDAIVKHWYK